MSYTPDSRVDFARYNYNGRTKNRLGDARLQREGQLGPGIVLAQNHFLLLLHALCVFLAHLLAFLVHFALLFDNGQTLLGLQKKKTE